MAGVLGFLFGPGEDKNESISTAAGNINMTSSSSAYYVASIDQGTSSSRCIVFGRDGGIVSEHQMEHEQFYPRPGCVEHDADEIWVCVSRCSLRLVTFWLCATTTPRLASTQRPKHARAREVHLRSRAAIA